MKKLLIIAAFMLSTGALHAQEKINKALATVTQQQGVYLFYMSTPVAEYEYLGTVKGASITWSGSTQESMNSIFKRLKKDYPQADGLIFHADDANKVDAIKFK